MKRPRSAGSSQSVYSSSNWSTTTSVAASPSIAGGCAPGCTSRVLVTPGTSPAPTDAIRPARSSEDFPLPDAPTSASRRRGASRSMTEPSTASRPKKNARSSASNASSPR